jgi:5-methylcytosine-specific restriction protein A
MESLAETFNRFAKLFAEQRTQSFGGNSSIAFIHKQAPKIIADIIGDDAYKVYGSVGTGAWAEIPWVAVLDKDISTTTQNGYYLVYLFDKTLKTIYLSLGVGYTQFEKEFGITEARNKIRAVSQHYAELISGNDTNFKPGLINLNAANNLGKGYEQGAVLSKAYEIDKLNDQELKSDLLTLLKYYKELKSIVGDSVLNIEIDVDAGLFDDQVKSFQKVISAKTYKDVDEKIIDELLAQTKEFPRQVKERLVKQIVRNRKIAELVKEKNKYICSMCGRHPFIQKNGRPYAEADHIVPIGGLTKGEDTAENLRCLCAQCHAVVTHGSEEEIIKLKEQLA